MEGKIEAHIPRLIMLQITQSKFSIEARVVLCSKLVVPRAGVTWATGVLVISIGGGERLRLLWFAFIFVSEEPVSESDSQSRYRILLTCL
jgi:hypothetical protein